MLYACGVAISKLIISSLTSTQNDNVDECLKNKVRCLLSKRVFVIAFFENSKCFVVDWRERLVLGMRAEMQTVVHSTLGKLGTLNNGDDDAKDKA